MHHVPSLEAFLGKSKVRPPPVQPKPRAAQLPVVDAADLLAKDEGGWGALPSGAGPVDSSGWGASAAQPSTQAPNGQNAATPAVRTTALGFPPLKANFRREATASGALPHSAARSKLCQLGECHWETRGWALTCFQVIRRWQVLCRLLGRQSPRPASGRVRRRRSVSRRRPGARTRPASRATAGSTTSTGAAGARSRGPRCASCRSPHKPWVLL